MRTLTLTLILVALTITAATGQESSTVQPYEDADAYKIYSLLLPQEESYAFAKDALMIQQKAIAQDISGACLKQADATRFNASIADYNCVQKKKWRFQPQFQIAKPYRMVGTDVISALPARPPSAASHVRMSPVGFNRDKTQAVVFMESSCGDCVGVGGFISLRRCMAKWKEAAIATCVGAS